MKKRIFYLILCLAAITSAWSLNEKKSAIPRPLVLPPRTSRRDMQRLIYLKHLLELNCLKQVCIHSYSKQPSGCLTSDAIKQTSPIKHIRNQFYYYNRMTENKFKKPSQHRSSFFPENRMIFTPQNVYFIIGRPPKEFKLNKPSLLRKFSQKKNTKSLQEANVISPNIENMIHFQGAPDDGESHTVEEKTVVENEGALFDIDGMPKDKFSKTTGIKPTTSHPFLQPNRIPQYEVEEIIDERSPVKDSKNLRSFVLGNKKLTEKLISEEGKKKKGGDDVQKIDIRNNSTTMKVLMGARNETVKQNSQNEFLLLSTTSYVKNLLNHRTPELNEGKGEDKIGKEQPKQLTITLPARTFHSRGQKITGKTIFGFEKPQSEPNANFNNTERVSTSDYVGGITESAKTSFTTSSVGTTPRQKITAATSEIQSEPFDGFDSLNFPDLITDRDFVPAATEMIQKPIVTGNDKPLTSSVTSSEIETTARLVSQGLREKDITPKSTDFSDEITDNSLGTNWTVTAEDTSAMVFSIKTVKYFSEATINAVDLTTPNFEEFTDQPLLFDLYPKSESKDPEVVWKNSRKMHFGELQKTTKSLEISGETEQRRSDILITENADYFDYENTFSTSNYLEKLKESGSFRLDDSQNLTSAVIIPLISVVINDLREGKISPEDIPALSDTFGKYWQLVLVLSNSTNLDMLPLMKMKDETDLENVLRNFLPAYFQRQTATKKTENDLNENFYYDLYDYMDIYKDFGMVREDLETHVNNESERFGNDGSHTLH